jgi:hypothetical protein
MVISHRGNTIKTTLRVPLIPIRISIIKEINNKYYRGFEEKQPLYVVGKNVN